MANNILTVKMQAKDSADIYLYAQIGFGGVTPEQFRQEWSSIPKNVKNVTFHLASAGGNPFDALAMYNVVKSSNKNVTLCVDGLAASAASLLAMCGNTIRMSKNAMMMVHNPSTMTWGDVEDHQKSIQMLEAVEKAVNGVYTDRTGKTIEEIRAICAAETWMTSQQCVDEGFADEIDEEESEMAASIDLADLKKRYHNAPAALFHVSNAAITPKQTNQKEPITMSENTAPAPATIQEIEAACPGANAEFVLAQAKSGATCSQAMTAYIAMQHAELKAAQEARAAADAKALAAEKKVTSPASTGVDPVATAGNSGAVSVSARAEWDKAVADKVKNLGMKQHKAISAVINENPALHASMLVEHNLANGRRISV